MLEAHLLFAAQLVARERGYDLDSSLKRLFGNSATATRATGGQLAGFLATVETSGAPCGVERVLADLRRETSAIAQLIRLRNGLLHAARAQAFGLTVPASQEEWRDQFIAAARELERLLSESPTVNVDGES